MIFNFVHESPFYELTALLTLAAVIGSVGLYLRQPMIVSYIAVGVLAGSSMLGIVQSSENIEILADLGIAVLLFLVGLKLDLNLVRTIGGVSLVAGLGQVFFTAVMGYGIGILCGFDPLAALYVAIAISFSSTIIVVKMLSDRKELDSLHGRIATGFLIVQDLVVVLAMMVLSSMGVGEHITQESGSLSTPIPYVIIGGGVFLLGIGFFIRYLATPLVMQMAKSPELLVTFAIGWAALFAAVSSYVGFSQELGGLLAGVSLASTPIRETIIARLSSLRDFLLLFFFVILGSQLDIGAIGGQIMPALAFSLFVLLGKPLIVMILMGAMGYKRRTSFLSAFSIAQISEFSLIFMTMGVSLGMLDKQFLGLITLIGIITIGLSVYLITYSHQIYRFVEPFLGIFEKGAAIISGDTAQQNVEQGTHDVVLFGTGRYGLALAEQLKRYDLKILGVDFNPSEVKKWQHAGYDGLYGDAFDPEFLSSLSLDHVKWVISAMPQYNFGLVHEDPRIALIDTLRHHGYSGKIAVSTQHINEVSVLKHRGADLVFLPFHDAAERAVERLRDEGL